MTPHLNFFLLLVCHLVNLTPLAHLLNLVIWLQLLNPHLNYSLIFKVLITPQDGADTAEDV